MSYVETTKTDIQSALFDMYNIKNTLPEEIKEMMSDNEGTEFKIKDCINDVILFLEELDNNCESDWY
jgi:hypothetical protein